MSTILLLLGWLYCISWSWLHLRSSIYPLSSPKSTLPLLVMLLTNPLGRPKIARSALTSLVSPFPSWRLGNHRSNVYPDTCVILQRLHLPYPIMSLLSLLLAFIALTLFSHNVVARSHILSRQCWHQHPFAAVNYFSSPDGDSEIVQELGGIAVEKITVRVGGTEAPPAHGVWSYPPVCTDVLQSVGSKLCVYTNTSFSNGRGISIFTTPKVAEDFATLPPFQDTQALHNINGFTGNWYTEELPGKGMGMLAKRNLKFKDRVTAYTPALLAYLEDELPTMEREKYFRIAVTQLPDATREMYESLATVYGYAQIKYQDVVKANTFQLEVGGHNHLSVFPETSRLNHACSPKYAILICNSAFRSLIRLYSAQYYLDPTLLTHFVHVTRPVAKGEEITISCMFELSTPRTFTD
jgi:hypothetical protein